MGVYEEATPATCPICGIGFASTDLRRHPDNPPPWWRCSDCGAEWSEWHRQREDRERPSEQIVRELADLGPFGDAEWGCLTACSIEGRRRRSFDDPANHDPSCLWRRARELYPAAESVVN